MATIKIKQIKSKISQVVEHEDNPTIRGMIRKVHHLVSVVD